MCHELCEDLCAENFQADQETETCICTATPSPTPPPTTTTPTTQSPTPPPTTITPTTPSPTPVSAPDYFVGKSNCNDSGPGTAQEPFCKVQVGINKLEPGDTLMILNGIYNEKVYVFEKSGTANAKFTIKGESLDAVIDAGCIDFPCDLDLIRAGEQFTLPDGETLNSSFTIGWSEHVTLDGFAIRNAPWQGIEDIYTSGVTIQNMLVQNAVSSLVATYFSNDIKLLRNEMSDGNLGYRTAAEGVVVPTDEEAVSFTNISSFEIANNYLHDSFKEGFCIKVQSNNGMVHHNTVERTCRVGIYIVEVHDIDTYANTVSDIGFIRNNLSDVGVRSDSVQRCRDVPTEHFDDFEPGVGIFLAVGDLGDSGWETGLLSNVEVYKNIVKNINIGCIGTWDELRENNRTLGPGTLTNVDIYNNVMYNCNRSPGGWGPGVLLDPSTVDAEIYNNIIASASATILMELPGASSTASNNLFAAAGDIFGTQSLNLTDPDDITFVDAANGDFHLLANSPAIDKGKDVGLPYAGSLPDIGAFEYGM